MFFFDDVLPLTLGTLHFEHHLSVEVLHIYHQSAAAVTAVPLLDVMNDLHTRTKIYKNNSK